MQSEVAKFLHNSERLAAIAEEMWHRDVLSYKAEQQFTHSHQAYRWARSHAQPDEAEQYRRKVRVRNRAAHAAPPPKGVDSDVSVVKKGEKCTLHVCGEVF